MIDRTIQLYKDSFSGLTREVWLLSLVMFLNRTGTMVITFLTIYLTVEMDFSLFRASVVMSCFGAGSLLGTYIGGWLTDRIGYHKVIFWSLFLTGIGFYFAVYMHTFWDFCIGIFLISTIADTLRPANLTAVGIYSSEENRTRSLSLIRLAFNMGIAIGPALGGFVSDLWGYHWLFYLDAITCVLASFFFLYALPRKEQTDQEKAAEAEMKAEKTLSAYKDPFFLKFVFFVFLNMIVFMLLFTLLPVYQKEHFQFSDFEIGLLLGANGLIIGLIEMPMVFVLEKKYKIFPLIIFGAFLIGFAYWIFPILGFWKGSAIISMLAITIGEIINFPFLNTIALNRAPANRRGEYMGLYGMSFSLALIITPTLSGWIVETYSWNTLWWIMGGINFVAIGGFRYLQKIYEVDQTKEAGKDVDLVNHLVP